MHHYHAACGPELARVRAVRPPGKVLSHQTGRATLPCHLSFWTSWTLVNLEFPAQRQKTASTVGFSPDLILAGWKPKKQCIQFHQRTHNLKCCNWARLGSRKIVKNKPSAVNTQLSEAIHNDVSIFLNGEVDEEGNLCLQQHTVSWV